LRDDFIFDEKTLVVFDLEWTAWPGSFERDWSGPGELREIIQFGAVKADVANNLAETGHFECFARPTVNPILSDYIIALTGITQPDVDAALAVTGTWPGVPGIHRRRRAADLLQRLRSHGARRKLRHQ
jgi:inhibitor of KinA sporulation pathway (predicted exonuclease)